MSHGARSSDRGEIEPPLRHAPPSPYAPSPTSPFAPPGAPTPESSAPVSPYAPPPPSPFAPPPAPPTFAPPPFGPPPGLNAERKQSARLIVLASLLAVSVIGLLAFAALGPNEPVTTTFNSPAVGAVGPAGDAWTAHSTRTDTSTIEWSMPEPEYIDGPRAMTGLDAVATYWVRGRGEPALRYDVAVVDRMTTWTGDAATDARAIITAIQEGASLGEAQPQADGTTHFTFVGPYEGRTYMGTIIVANRVAVVVSVGYRDAADLDRAASELITMTTSVTVSPR